MKRALRFVYSFVFLVGCDLKPDPKADVEAERVRRLAGQELHTGDSEQQAREWIRSQGWPVGPSKYGLAAEPYRSPDNSHTVTLYVYLDGDNRVASTRVEIYRTYY